MSVAETANAARDYYEQACARSLAREIAGAPDLEQMRERYRRLYEYGEAFMPDSYFPDVDSFMAALDEEWTARRSVEECISQRLDEVRGAFRLHLANPCAEIGREVSYA